MPSSGPSVSETGNCGLMIGISLPASPSGELDHVGGDARKAPDRAATIHRSLIDQMCIRDRVVPVEEATAEAFGVLDAAKALGEGRLILEGLEVAFGERVVVGGIPVSYTHLAA